MGGGAGRSSTKKREEGDCVTLRWLGDHAHCARCKEKRWRTPCQSKHYWAKLGPTEREEYRRGAAVVEIEMSETRASAEVASEAIAKQLEDEEAGDPAPVKRKAEAPQHGIRTGSVGLTSPPPAPRPATSEVSPATEHTIKSTLKLPWKKAKACLQGFSKSYRLYKYMWSLPERQIVAVAAYRSCREQQFDVETNKGLLKGLTIAGYERGLWDKDGKVDGKAVLLDEMQSVMGDQPDFRDEPCLLEELHEQLGMFMLFAPRFHAELQLSIERAWATSKGGVREKCDYSITTLRKNIEPSLDAIPVELFRKWQRTEQQWEEAYRTGATQINVEGRVQQIKKTLYASHRVAPAAPPAPKSRKRSIGKISKAAHKQHVVLDDDYEMAPERKHTQWVKEMKLLYEKDDGTVHRLVDVAWCDDCADGEGGVESAMIGWTYECESWSSHMPSRCGKLDYSRCYPYPIADVEQMVEDYAAAKAAKQLPWE
jgi:hypothetical protein